MDGGTHQLGVTQATLRPPPPPLTPPPPPPPLSPPSFLENADVLQHSFVNYITRGFVCRFRESASPPVPLHGQPPAFPGTWRTFQFFFPSWGCWFCLLTLTGPFTPPPHGVKTGLPPHGLLVVSLGADFSPCVCCFFRYGSKLFSSPILQDMHPGLFSCGFVLHCPLYPRATFIIFPPSQ